MSILNYHNSLASKLSKLRKKTISIIQKTGRKLTQNLLEQEKVTDNYQDAKLRKFIDLLGNNKGGLNVKLSKELMINLIEAGAGRAVGNM